MNFYHNAQIEQRLEEAERSVLAGEKTSFAAASELLEMYYLGIKN